MSGNLREDDEEIDLVAVAVCLIGAGLLEEAKKRIPIHFE